MKKRNDYLHIEIVYHFRIFFFRVNKNEYRRFIRQNIEKGYSFTRCSYIQCSSTDIKIGSKIVVSIEITVPCLSHARSSREKIIQ